MRKFGSGVLAWLLVSAGIAGAAPLTEEESAWVVQCVARLSSASERVGAGAEAALREAGPDAIGAMAAAANGLSGEAAWTRFARVLRSFGAQAAADALELARPRWPAEAVERLAALRDELSDATRSSEVDPKIDEEVRKLLSSLSGARSYSSDNPIVQRIAAMGRKAVPSLGKYLRELRPGFPPGGFDGHAAGDALEDLVEEEDLPMLAELLENGILEAARAAAAIGTEAARDALLVPVGKGMLGHDLVSALTGWRDDPVVHRALIEFLRTSGPHGGWNVGAAAEFLADGRVVEAVPVLQEILAAATEVDTLRPVAEALAELGEKAGIPVLIDCLAESGFHGDWQRHEAGEALNRITGRRIYIGSFHPGKSEGNYEEAAEEFRKWWSESGDHLEFDPKWRRWRVRKD